MATDITIPGTAKATGRKAQRSGNRAEKALMGMHRIYEMEGRAYIDQQHCPTRGGPRARTLAGRAPVDFAGVIVGSGRAIFAELKSTGEGKRSLEFGDRGIRPEQVEALACRGRAGAVSVLIWMRGYTVGVCLWSHVEGFAAMAKPLPATAFRWLNPMDFDWLPVALVLAYADTVAKVARQ